MRLGVPLVGCGDLSDLRQLTEISEYSSQEMSTGGDPSLEIRTSITIIFKMNGVLPSAVIWKELKIIHICWSVLIFRAAPQNKLTPKKKLNPVSCCT